MATRKTPKKYTEKKDVKTEAQQLIQGAINSTSSLLIPCKDANFIYVRNPVTNLIKHFDCKDINLTSYVKEMTTIGLGEKLLKDFKTLVSDIDSKWSVLLEDLESKNAFKIEE